MDCVIVRVVCYFDEFPVKILASAVRQYLQEVLGLPTPEINPWARANELPYFLRDAFQFSELELLGQPVVLAMARVEQRHVGARLNLTTCAR